MSEHPNEEPLESKEEAADAKKDEELLIERRALLRAGWTAPIILGVALASGTARAQSYNPLTHVHSHTDQGAGMTHTNFHQNLDLPS